jgi:hypothetical protein
VVKTIFASVGTPTRANEDYVVCGQNWAVVLDGATPGGGVESGCVHDVPWLVRQLGGRLALLLTSARSWSLAKILADAIEGTCEAHMATCDLANPHSPSSTVAIARTTEQAVEHLVLADSPILYRDHLGDLTLIQDDRTARLPRYDTDTIASHRNQPHGFWVASTQPLAAEAAIIGSRPRERVTDVYLISDGASRYVDLLALGTWEQMMESIDLHGPEEVIRAVRQAEAENLPAMSIQPNGRRLKRHDDASIVHLSGVSRSLFPVTNT